MSRHTILTGDRPTGPLHLGHYTGSLANRVALQHSADQYILVADLQALTDNADNPMKVRDNVLAVVSDYLAVGIDPDMSTIALQSELPALTDLTMLYMNLISVGHLERNPTIRSEITSRGYERSVPVGFLAYPVAQAADITAFNADLVPAGADQAPLIEVTNTIVSRVNARAGSDILRHCTLLEGHGARLPGVDGLGKMSKSAGNSIALRDDADTVRKKVMSMFTDPNHLRVTDPGKVEGNVVFAFLDAFDENTKDVEALKLHDQNGGLGDVVLKRRLIDILQAFLEPVRARHATLAADPEIARCVLRTGTLKAMERTEVVRDKVRKAFGLSYIL